MDASLYLELVEAVAKVNSGAGLRVAAERISATPMHPLERRVLDRALRARTEALALRRQLTTRSLGGASGEAESLLATG